MGDKYSRLGAGFSTFDGSDNGEDPIRNVVLEFEARELDTGASCVTHFCNSSEDICEKLQISGSSAVDASLGSFKIKAEFAQELCKKTNAITILVTSKKYSKAEIKEATFKKSLTLGELLKQGGDSYVRKVETGAEYIAAYQFVASSSTERQKIVSEVEGKFGQAVKAEASLKADLEKLKEKSINVSDVKQKFIGFAGEYPSADNIVNYALRFPAQDIPNPDLLSFDTMSYSHIAGCPEGFDKVDAWLKAYKSPKWYEYSLGLMECQAGIIRSQIQAVQDLYTFYGQGDVDPTMADTAAKLKETEVKIRNWRGGFDPSKTPTKLDIAVDKWQVPSPHFDLEEGYLHGRNTGGVPFRDIEREMICCYVYPKTWRCKGSAVIDSLTSTYGLRDPAQPSNERREKTFDRTHGGSEGTDFPVGAVFGPNEIGFTGVWLDAANDGRWNDCVNSFEIKRRSDPNVSIKWGRGDTRWNGGSVPAGVSFVGWQGRQGSYIDALQPLYVRFHPAYWDKALMNGKR